MLAPRYFAPRYFTARYYGYTLGYRLNITTFLQQTIGILVITRTDTDVSYLQNRNLHMQTIKAGDTAIQFTSTLIKDDSEVWTLSGASVYFVLRKGDDSYVFDAEIVSTADKVVRYVLDESEFPTEPGIYSQEWKVVFADDTILRFPNDGYNRFAIKNNLEPYDDIS